jgi:hypothetical protein
VFGIDGVPEETEWCLVSRTTSKAREWHRTQLQLDRSCEHSGFIGHFQETLQIPHQRPIRSPFALELICVNSMNGSFFAGLWERHNMLPTLLAGHFLNYSVLLLALTPKSRDLFEIGNQVTKPPNRERRPLILKYTVTASSPLSPSYHSGTAPVPRDSNQSASNAPLCSLT